MKQGYVYIMSNKKHGTLYIGVTANLAQRVEQHKSLADRDSFTARYKLTMLVYYTVFPHIRYAILAEKRMKKWKREIKVRLIERLNPEWNDLSITEVLS